MSGDTIIFWCFKHFKAMDEANAAIHTAQVRYSPITFRCAEWLAEMQTTVHPHVLEVVEHKGEYEEDKGR